MDISNNSNFFDNNSNIYGEEYASLSNLDKITVDFIKKKNEIQAHLLDIGGGSGVFASYLLKEIPKIEISIIDPSKYLLNKIKKNESIHTIIGDLPYNLNLNQKFDYIHLRKVIHHLTGATINNCVGNVLNSFKKISILLKSSGFFILHDHLYESYVKDSWFRTILFYFLTIQNKLKIRLPLKDFILGLSVCFFPEKEVIHLLKQSGFNIVYINKIIWAPNLISRISFIKTRGEILIIAQKSKN